MTDKKLSAGEVELLPCPFCGTTPTLPSGEGTQYEIECDECGAAAVGVQICDLMTLEERASHSFANFRYGEEFVDRAKREAISRWQARAALSQQPECGKAQLQHEGLAVECQCTPRQRFVGGGCPACNLNDEIHQLAFEIGEPDESACGYWFEMEQFDDFISKLKPMLAIPAYNQPQSPDAGALVEALVRIAKARRSDLLSSRFPDNDEGDYMARVRDASVDEIDKTLAAYRAQGKGAEG